MGERLEHCGSGVSKHPPSQTAVPQGGCNLLEILLRTGPKRISPDFVALARLTEHKIKLSAGHSENETRKVWRCHTGGCPLPPWLTRLPPLFTGLHDFGLEPASGREKTDG